MRYSERLREEEKRLLRDKVEEILSETLEQEGGIRRNDEGLKTIAIAAKAVTILRHKITKHEEAYRFAKRYLKTLLKGEK